MTEQDKQALIKHFCSRDCGEAAENCAIMPCWEIELIQEFPVTEADSDTISRAKAIDIVNHNRFGMQKMTFDIITTALIELPPAEPKIIYCKDCQYFKQVFAPNDNDGLCGHWHSKCDARTSREGYCSHAERKQNDTERC